MSIELKKVSKRFVDNVVLDGVDFFVAEGETVALLGPSGVGKSVLLKHIIGLIKPDSGEVYVDGQLVPLLRRKALAALRSRIGYVFQNGALFDSMDVFENIRLGITDNTEYTDRDYCIKRVKECLRLVNLPEEVGRKLPSELSGGMRKRVGIARALVNQPEMMLFDEPTAGLDPTNARLVAELISQVQEGVCDTAIVVTHDLELTRTVADRAAILIDGQFAALGPRDAVLASADPAVQAFLAGEAR